MSQPTITFTVKDDGNHQDEQGAIVQPHHYEFWLWVKPTREEPNSVEFHGYVHKPGTYTIFVQKTNDGLSNISLAEGGHYDQDHALTEWGLYSFDMQIKELNEHNVSLEEPLVALRSQKIMIPSFMPTQYKDSEGNLYPGHEAELRSTVEDDPAWYISYFLDSDKDASSVEVAHLDKNMAQMGSYQGSTEKRNPKLDIKFGNALDSEDDDSDEKNFFVFAANDAFAEVYRDHKNRAMEVVNKRPVHQTAHVYASTYNWSWQGPTGTGDMTPENIFWPAFLLKKATYKPIKHYQNHTSVGVAKFDGASMKSDMTKSGIWFYAGHGNAPELGDQER